MGVVTPSSIATRAMIRSELGELVNDWPSSLVDEAVRPCVGHRLSAGEVASYPRRLAERCADVARMWRGIEAKVGETR